MRGRALKSLACAAGLWAWPPAYAAQYKRCSDLVPSPALQTKDAAHCLAAADQVGVFSKEDPGKPERTLCKAAVGEGPVQCFCAANTYFADPSDQEAFKKGYAQAAVDYCKGSGSLGRMHCYVKAKSLAARHPEFDEEGARRFCEVAQSTQPVSCYLRAHSQLPPDDPLLSLDRSAPDGSRSKAFELCAGSGSEGRIDCYAALKGYSDQPEFNYGACKTAAGRERALCLIRLMPRVADFNAAFTTCTGEEPAPAASSGPAQP